MKLGGIFLSIILAVGIIPIQYIPIDSAVLNHLIPNAHAQFGPLNRLPNPHATISLSPINGTWSSGQKIPLTLVDSNANKDLGNREHLDNFNSNVDMVPTMTIGNPLTIESGNGPTAIFTHGGLNDRLLVTAKDDSIDAKISGRAMLVPSDNFGISNGDSLIVDLHDSGGDLLKTINDVTGSNKDFRGFNMFNYDVRSLISSPSSPFLPTLSTSVFLVVNNAGTGIFDKFGNVTNSASQLIPLGSGSGAFGLLFLNNNALLQNQQPLTDLSNISNTASIGLMFTFTTNGHFVVNNSRLPIVADFFSIGIVGDGSKGDQRINNAVYRWELEETDINNGVFAGTSQYVMLNQLNIFDANTYSSLRTIDNAVKFAAMTDMSQSEVRGPEIKYLDTLGNNTGITISAEQDIRTSTGFPTFDKVNYVTGDTVSVTLWDPDLNVDNDLIDIYTAVAPVGNLAHDQDVAVDTIGTAGLGTNSDGSAFGKLLEVVFGNDDTRWSNAIIPGDLNHGSSCTFANAHGTNSGNMPGITTGGFDPSLSATGFDLVETGPSTGIFTGTFSFPDELCQNGRIVPTTGMDIKAKYFDFADNSGLSNERDDYVGGYGFVDTLKIMPQFASFTKINQVIPQPNETLVPVVVFFRNSSSVHGGIDELQQQANVTVGNTIDLVPSVSATIPVSELDNISNKFAVAIFRDSQVSPASLDTDQTIHADNVWTSSPQSFNGSGIKIAILDTGIDLSNPEFNKPLKNAGCHDATAVTIPDNCVDMDHHGTHVAGIALAPGTSTVMLSNTLKGVAPDASFMAVKVLPGSSSSVWTTVATGISWALSHGAKVINLSLEDTTPGVYDGSNCDQNPEVGGILPYFVAATIKGSGVPLIVASGNYFKVAGPACITYAIAVGAVYGKTGVLFTDTAGHASGTGKALQDHGLVAPGVQILSTSLMSVNLPQRPVAGIETDSGTSMAAPAVTGTVALMLQKDSLMTPRTIAQILFNTACRTTITPNPCVASPMVNMSNELFGHGEVDALAAVNLVGTPLPSFDQTTVTEQFAISAITLPGNVDIVATVKDSGVAITTGTVAFDDGDNHGTFSGATTGAGPSLIPDTCVLSSSTGCRINYAPSKAGNIVITALYEGDGTHDSKYQTRTLVVNPSTPGTDATTLLISSPSSISPSGKVTVDATVTDTSTPGTSPDGTVIFDAGGSGSFDVTTKHCSTGVNPMQCSEDYTAPSTPSSVTITATYSPTTTAHSSSSNHLNVSVQSVVHTTPVITIQPSPTFTVKQGDTMEFVATVTDPSATPTPLGGTVHFNVVSGVGGNFGPSPCSPLGSNAIQCTSTYNAPSSHGDVTISANYVPSPTDLHNTISINEDGQVTDCLIATAAFGSALSPQVQFLRDFRDNNILQTSDGSSFMIAFNAWYYSFSPYVANFEDTQPWFKQIVKTSIYPLVGILTASEKSYSILPGEFGSLFAGLVASSLIGAVYFWPFALVSRQIRFNHKYNYKLAAVVCSSILLATVCSMMIGNQTALIITTSLFVLSMTATFATISANAIMKICHTLKNHTRFLRTSRLE
jgi:hypothetical protein